MHGDIKAGNGRELHSSISTGAKIVIAVLPIRHPLQLRAMSRYHLQALVRRADPKTKDVRLNQYGMFYRPDKLRLLHEHGSCEFEAQRPAGHRVVEIG